MCITDRTESSVSQCHRRPMQFLAVVALLVASVCASFIPPATWENTQYHRFIDLSKSYTRETLEIEAKNIDSKPNGEYFLALPNYVFDQLSVFGAFSGFNGKQGDVLATELIEDVTNVNGQPLIKYIKVGLPQPIAPKQSYKFKVTLAITDLFQPMPSKIDLTAEQTLLLKTNKIPISAYKTLASELNVGGITDAQEVAVPGKEIDYEGTVENGFLSYKFDTVEPFTFKILNLVYSHNFPLTKVTKLERGIWVSHWANTLEFEEFYKMTNNAAQLNKGFSRADLMLHKGIAKQSHSIHALELKLNPDSTDQYYTDLVGNVSTSRSFSERLYIRPRYPVYGGWNYNFTVGWTNKLNKYLREMPGTEYILNVPLLNGPTDATYDEVELSFYLPEGSEFVEIESPLPYESIIEGTELSYFDLNNGHTKITLKFNNLIDDVSNVEILIKYKYTTLAAIRKPLDVAKFIFIALLGYLALTKIDVSLKARK